MAQRLRRLHRSNGLCEDCKSCGAITVATQVDHVIPLAQGGSDEDDNTRNLCDYHHKVRTAEQFGHRVKVRIGADGWPA